jgi:hypothetical protein
MSSRAPNASTAAATPSKQRLVQLGIAFDLEECRLVALHHLGTQPLVVLGRQNCERLRQRQPDDGERRFARRRHQPEAGEGMRHRLADAILAVDERTIAIEDDELHQSSSS